MGSMANTKLCPSEINVLNGVGDMLSVPYNKMCYDSKYMCIYKLLF